ncbi:MAG: hypothetical protein ACK5XB_02190 [Rhodospirillales bacterium]|jgi:hypothetical protein
MIAQFNGLFIRFNKTGRADAGAAFDAIEFLAEHKVRSAGSLETVEVPNFAAIDPKSWVKVPWWVVFVIAQGWTDYRLNWAHSDLSDVRNKKRKTMEQSFGLAGKTGKGAKPVMQKEALIERHRILALLVDQMLRDNPRASTTSAWKAVGDSQHVDWHTVRRAYQKNRAQIERMKGPLPS